MDLDPGLEMVMVVIPVSCCAMTIRRYGDMAVPSREIVGWKADPVDCLSFFFLYFSGCFSFDTLGDSRTLPVHFIRRSTGPRFAFSRSTRTDWIFIDRRRTSINDDGDGNGAIGDACGYRRLRWSFIGSGFDTSVELVRYAVISRNRANSFRISDGYS